MWIGKELYAALVRDNNTSHWTAKVIEERDTLIAELKVALAAERKRSDNAVDRLLNSKGLPAVTPPDKVTLEELSSMFEETPESVEAIHKAIEEHGIEEVLFSEGN